MMKELRLNSPKSPSEILMSSFLQNIIIHTWDVGFSKSKAIEFHGLGWVSMSKCVGDFCTKICIQRGNG
jgi:hypothetical protein